MPDEKLQPQLRMLHPELGTLPGLTCPEGYALRSYRPGDAAHWERILKESFESEFSFDRTMRFDVSFRPERLWFVTSGELPVAVAAAFHVPTYLKDAGMVHFVGVCPDHRGHALGAVVVLAALQQMVRDGRKRAWLSTDDWRLAALKTYLRLGFEPLLVDENQRARWPVVFQRLGLPEMTEKFHRILDGPVFAPPQFPADMCDYAERLNPRRRWHAARACGTLHQDDIVSRDDESLYRGTRLGTAGASIANVTAREDRAFEIWFRAGPAGIDTGTEVRFFTVGQRPLGTGPQIADADAPGYVEVVACPERVTVEPLRLGFRVTDGALSDGDEVRLACGRAGGFTWTPLAVRKDIEVIVDAGGGEPKMRLPEPVVVRVEPRAAHRLEVLLPATASPGEPVRAAISVRDDCDNRVPVCGPVRVEIDGRAIDGRLTDGLARVDLGAMGDEPLRCRATCETTGLAAPSNACLPTDGGPGLYFGDMHVHDSTCEGQGFSTDAYRWAIDEKRLDFMSLAVQCHNYEDNDKWHLIKHLAQAYLDEGRFVTFPALEWQHSSYGDKVVHFVGGDQPFLPVDDPRYDHPWKLYEALRGSDAFIISHHPGYAIPKWVPGTDFDAMETDVDRCVEIWSMHGSSEGYDPADRPLRGPRREEGVMAALKAGLRVGLVAGSDTHTARPGGSALEPLGYWGGLCAVWADSLTRRGLYEAFMARRTYALTGARIALRFTVNDAPMGAEIGPADSYRVRAEAWAPEEIATVEILRSGDVLHTENPGQDAAAVELDDAPPASDAPLFYHCRVTLTGGDLAVCTPVWIDR